MNKEAAIRWAWVRLLLGNLQMGGALAAAFLLCRSGICVAAIATALATAAVTNLSIYLFQIRRVQEGDSWKS